jgi:coenzyme F420-reducing hydrogenase alpha subunit
MKHQLNEVKRMQQLAGVLKEAQEKIKISDEDIEPLKSIAKNIHDLARETELKVGQLRKQYQEIEDKLAEKYLGPYKGPERPNLYIGSVDISSKTVEWMRYDSGRDYYSISRG